ncbi:pyridoxal phosphate-dependent aminotransferase [Wenzhouxiangella marina]|uniref:Aspartate aminotransferase n=1 Tax=Wenzhouxiangella marina TaxID=1579979 RepID=A0A0K0XXX6_9GAMM|nr:pyridoxal phosphate-dependent aminotransferase [Wenzhouxiangella marina]AKS42530.1 Aspartate aminotransferase [Wenzhouxiangella marina]MBB6085693.1 N-succinyldiaminopimelate aminotransferase [Wenzhouxiangella marina]
MPRFPEITAAARAVSGSVYSKLERDPDAPPPVPLHVGDTWMEPAVGCRMQDLTVEAHPGMHRYSDVPGLPALRQRIAEVHGARAGYPTGPEQVLVTAGATAGLAATVGALVAPGEEVLLAAPYWPLIAGSLRAFGARPVDVDLMIDTMSADEAVARFEAARSDRTVAVYWNTPHNPTGRLLPKSWLEALSEWARSHGLWIFSDEVYEDYVYEGEHHYTRALAPECTISVHSFSKAYGMAGNRCGYLVAPEEVIGAVKRIMTNINYSACTASQLAALNALDGAADAWVRQAREKYAEIGRRVADRLGLDAPRGSTFLFVDVTEALDERGLSGLLADLGQAGVLVAPGPSFGPYPNHVRVCFTAAEPARTLQGVEILARHMKR